MRSLILFLITTAFTNASYLGIRELANDPILLLKTLDCKFKSGSIKIIHPINLTNLENNVYNFAKIARKLDTSLPIAN